MNKNLIIPVLIAVLMGGVGFYGGMKYQQSKVPVRQFGQGQGQGQNRVRMGGQVTGEILAMDDKSVTVKLADGSSKIILLSSTTTFSATAAGAKSDLKVGVRVAVFGTTNSDGSVTATNVQINPMFGGNRIPNSSPSSQ